MVRGIRFQIPNEHSNFLELVLSNTNIEGYYWFVSDDQVFLSASNGFLFEDREYSGSEFRDIIKNNKYYVCFAVLTAFLNKTDYVKVNHYRDFVSSNCQMMIICCDSVFVDIYCKDIKVAEIIMLNAKQNDFTQIEYITDKNDLYEDCISL